MQSDAKHKTISFKKISVCAALVFFAAALAIKPQRYVTVCLEGISLWAECVLPSLFPFMVVCLLLSGLGAVEALSRPFAKPCKRLGLSPAAAPLFILSAVSGYPAGSRLVSEYRERGLISQADAVRLAPLCSSCSPMFALGTVGVKAFGGGYYGVKLLAASIISVIATSVIYCLFTKNKIGGSAYLPHKRGDGDLLFSAFYGGVTASLTAGGFICFFYTVSQVIADFNIFMPLTALLRPVLGGAAEGLTLGLAEATGGCFAAAAAGGFFALPVAGFLTVSGGASIICQQLCYLVKCGVKPSFFISFKLLQGAAAFALLCLFSLF